MSFNNSNGNINFDINSHTNKFLFRNNESILMDINSDSNYNTKILPTPHSDITSGLDTGSGGPIDDKPNVIITAPVNPNAVPIAVAVASAAPINVGIITSYIACSQASSLRYFSILFLLIMRLRISKYFLKLQASINHTCRLA